MPSSGQAPLGARWLIGVTGPGALTVAVTVVATLVVVAALAAAVSLVRAARHVRAVADRLDADHQAALAELEAAVRGARAELARVDDLIGSAESLTDTVGSASRLAHAALAGPVIKVMAFGAGTARAGRRLRERAGPRR